MHSALATLCLVCITTLTANGINLTTEICINQISTKNCTDFGPNDCCFLDFCCWSVENSAEKCNVCENVNHCCPKDYCCLKRDETKSEERRAEFASYVIFLMLVIFCLICGWFCRNLDRRSLQYSFFRTRRPSLTLTPAPSSPPEQLTAWSRASPDDPPPYSPPDPSLFPILNPEVQLSNNDNGN